MISDFFHPAVGGVENHIFSLAANLIKRGHKVSGSANTPFNLFLKSIGHSDHSQSPKRSCRNPVVIALHQGLLYTLRSHCVFSYSSQLSHFPAILSKYHNSGTYTPHTCPCKPFVAGSRSYPTCSFTRSSHCVYRSQSLWIC